MAGSIERLNAALEKLRREAQRALRQHDQYAYHYPDPELCDAVASFSEELQAFTGGDEIARRADIAVQRTSEDTPYALALLGVDEAGLRQHLPMGFLKTGDSRLPSPHSVRTELAAARKLLGPLEDRTLTSKQKAALRKWETELEKIEAEATSVFCLGCQWLKLLRDWARGIRDGVLADERPDAEYRDWKAVGVAGSRLTRDAIGLSLEAADVLVEWATEQTHTLEKADTAHSPDFHSVRWFGTEYTFTNNQAPCVQALWEAWEKGTPELSGEYLLEKADACTSRLNLVFRNSEAWGRLIVPGTRKGNYRLKEPN